ncbi:ribosomal protein L37E [Wenyingzhuangia heitensis]|uniref:Ribosomal protein L37E n=1 Tax=Wenyingzhuangia heitensis TaxID=1487859 RepID=A0ABX0UB29_9FLAO|nr:hypothetical protein [Wenyingzhuangia heitensis]NIJ45140.1 ribosomal protein L37E [Wenyingzhuangia heitensis]
MRKFTDLENGINIINCTTCSFTLEIKIEEYGPPNLPKVRSYVGQCEECGTIIYNYRKEQCACGGSFETEAIIFCESCHGTDFLIDRTNEL